MRKVLVVMCLITAVLFVGCASKTENKVSETVLSEKTDIVTEVAIIENETDNAVVTEETKEEPVVANDTEAVVDDNDEFVETMVESTEDYWTDEKVQEFLGDDYDLTHYMQVANYERGGSKLLAYVENVEKMPISLVIYCKADETAELLLADKSMFSVKSSETVNLVDYQNFDNTVFIESTITMGNCLPLKTWHITEEGTIIDLADTIDFEVKFKELYIGGYDTEDNYKTVIGLREQIPDTVTVGSSQLIPVTLDENEKIVLVEDVAPLIG